jgi:hypothetical protein
MYLSCRYLFYLNILVQVPPIQELPFYIAAPVSVTIYITGWITFKFPVLADFIIEDFIKKSI